MLIVTRRRGESVHVGEHITIWIHSIRGAQIQLGISAPPHTKILRSELKANAQYRNTGRSVTFARPSRTIRKRSSS